MSARVALTWGWWCTACSTDGTDYLTEAAAQAHADDHERDCEAS